MQHNLRTIAFPAISAAVSTVTRAQRPRQLSVRGHPGFFSVSEKSQDNVRHCFFISAPMRKFFSRTIGSHTPECLNPDWPVIVIEIRLSCNFQSRFCTCQLASNFITAKEDDKISAGVSILEKKKKEKHVCGKQSCGIFLDLQCSSRACFSMDLFAGNPRTKNMQADLDGARRTVAPAIYSPNALGDLPAPVQRYFMAVLNEGQPMVTAVAVEHTGTFNLSETGENWTPFTSVQRVVMQRPDSMEADVDDAVFDRSRHDAYIACEGIPASFAFAYPTGEFARQPRRRALRIDALLAEAAGTPPHFLPSQCVQGNESMTLRLWRPWSMGLRGQLTFSWRSGLIGRAGASAAADDRDAIMPTAWKPVGMTTISKKGCAFPCKANPSSSSRGAKTLLARKLARVAYDSHLKVSSSQNFKKEHDLFCHLSISEAG
jgi:hypothetical protein